MTEVSLTPGALTGAQVLEVRNAYNIGRAEFAKMCGFPGPSRITNIETKDSWKPGDREKILAVIQQLQQNPPKEKNGRLKGESAMQRAERLDAMMAKRKQKEGSPPLADAVLVEVLDNTVIELDEEPPTTIIAAQLEATHANTLPDPNSDVNRIIERKPHPPLIALEPGVRYLTNSEVGVWQRCRRKWWLAFYRKLAALHQDLFGPRAIGNRVHRALAAWYVPDGEERTDPRQALEAAIVEDWTALVEQERQKPSYVDDETSLSMLSSRFQDAVTLERAMVEGYMQWLEERGDDAQYTVIAPETEVTADIDGKVGDDQVSVRLRALLDVKLRRNTDGALLFEDHKTVGNFSEPRKTLHMDPQMLEYHLIEWLNIWDGEQRCDGALYNMLRKVKRTASAKPPFYERVEVRHNTYELDAYKRRLLGVARDIMRAERELAAGGDPMSIVYPNPTRTCSWDCDFFSICPMFDDGSRVEDALSSLFHEIDPMARYDRSRNEES